MISQYQEDILTKDLEYLQKHYRKKDGSPKIKDERSLKQLKRIYRKKVLSMEKDPSNRQPKEEVERLLGEHGISADGLPPGEVGFHIGYIKNSDGEIEYTKPLPSFKPGAQQPKDLAEIWVPATPAKITPTRRKAIQRASKLILVYGDAQIDYRRYIDPVTDEQELIPLHNEAMLDVIQQINADYMPETTVNLGDMADMAALSRFDPDSNHFHQTMSMSMQRVHDFYAQLVANNPKGKHVEVDSNHAIRPKKTILKQVPGLHNFVLPGEQYPLLSYARLANLGKLGIHFVAGYGNAEYVYGAEYEKPPIVFKHGTSHSSSPGATVRKEMSENPEINIVRGHGHRHEEVRRTMRNGWQLFYLMLGSSCLNRGPVPGYASSVDDFGRPVANQNPHQNTIAMIEDTMDGNYNITTLNVINGKTTYNGKEYRGNE